MMNIPISKKYIFEVIKFFLIVKLHVTIILNILFILFLFLLLKK